MEPRNLICGRQAFKLCALVPDTVSEEFTLF